jgi:hypothetical protein
MKLVKVFIIKNEKNKSNKREAFTTHRKIDVPAFSAFSYRYHTDN